MQIEETIRRCVVFLYAGAGEEKRPVGTGFFVSQEASGRSPDYLPRYREAHRRGCAPAGQRLYARVNVRGPLDLLLLDEAGRESDRLKGNGETQTSSAFSKTSARIRRRPLWHKQKQR